MIVLVYTILVILLLIPIILLISILLKTVSFLIVTFKNFKSNFIKNIDENIETVSHQYKESKQKSIPKMEEL